MAGVGLDLLVLPGDGGWTEKVRPRFSIQRRISATGKPGSEGKTIASTIHIEYDVVLFSLHHPIPAEVD